MKPLLLSLSLLLAAFGQEAAQPAAGAEPAKEPAKDEKTQAAPAQGGGTEFTGSVDLGYRVHTDIVGNAATYRSVVNLGEGPKVLGFDLSLTSTDAHRKFDRILLNGFGWGGDPYTGVRLDAVKERIYDLHVDYRNIAYYNFLPSFANPLLDSGVLGTEHGLDTRRRFLDSELRLFPGTRIIPYIAYSRDAGSGAGVTTFVAPGDEFPVYTTLDDHTNRIRGGVHIEFSKFHATAEQGYTSYGDDQTASNTTQNFGNRTTPIFGTTLYLTNLLQQYHVIGDGSITKGQFSATPFSWLDISGQAIRSTPNSTVNYTHTANGTFFDNATLQVLSLQQDTFNSSANMPHSSGSLAFELRPLRRIRILESWMTDRFQNASAGMILDLTNLSTDQVQHLQTDFLDIKRNRQELNVLFDAFRWLTLRGGYRYEWGDAVVRGNPLVSDTPTESGRLQQSVALAGAQFRPSQKLSINADLEAASATRSYFRTSLHDYWKGKLRARYQVLKSLQFTASTNQLYNENPTPGVNYNFESHQTSVGLFWNPDGGKHISVLGDYTRSTLSTSISYVVPQDFSQAISNYKENAHVGTAVMELNPLTGKYAPHISLGGSFFTSGGSRPENFWQPIAKITLPLHERVQVFSEWRWYSLSESTYLYEGFRTHMFVSGLRLLR